jgi:Flp pilus assembly protein TadD
VPTLPLSLLALSLAACGGASLPAEAVTHNGEGVALLAEGRLDDAEARFRLALEYAARFSEPHANLGVVALERGDLREAERCFRTAIEIRPDFAQAWANLGLVLDRRGELDDARDAYEEALSIDPGLLPPRWNLALLLARRGDYARARAQAMRLVQITDDPEAIGLLAYAELRLGRPDAAAARAEEVLARTPDEAMARAVRGVARAMRGDLDGAVEDLVAASAHPVVGWHAKARLAAVYLLRGERDEAEALLAELHAHDPHDPAVAYLREHAPR